MLKHCIFTAAMLMGLAAFETSAQWNASVGYRSFYELGVNIKGSDYAKTGFEISTTQGYQVIPAYLFLGTGAGFQALFNANGACAFPVYVDIRSNFSNAAVSPYIQCKIGYASTSGNSSRYSGGGFYLCPALGLRFALTPGVGMNISAGYTLQYADVWEPYAGGGSFNGYGGWHNRNIGGFTLKAGVEF